MKMLQAGEDRMTESVEERLESGGADEVLGECTADQSTLFEDAPSRMPRVAQSFHFKVELLVPVSWDGSRLEAILQAQVAQHPLERQLR